MFVLYSDDATFVACIPPPNMRYDVVKSINRDFKKNSECCTLHDMKGNSNRGKSVLAIRFRTYFRIQIWL